MHRNLSNLNQINWRPKGLRVNIGVEGSLFTYNIITKKICIIVNFYVVNTEIN